MARLARWFFLLGVSAAAVWTVSISFAQPQPVTSYTAVIHEVRYNAAGLAGYEETATVAVRSDGSEVKTATHIAPDGRRYEVRSIRDVSAKRGVTIDGLTQSTTTYSLSDATIANMRNSWSSCRGLAHTAGDTVAGLPTVHVSVPQPGPAGRHVEQWFAPDLNCAVLKSNAVHSTNGPKTTQEALSVSRGEPDPQLFLVPDGYTERSPGEVLAERARRFGKKYSAETATQLNQVYQLHQAR